MVRGNILNNMNLEELITENKLILVPVLIILGFIIKKIQKIPDKFIPLIESLIREYRGLIDYCAIANKISPLYKNFGRNNFDDLCKHLLDLCNKEQILIDLGIPFKETEMPG